MKAVAWLPAGVSDAAVAARGAAARLELTPISRYALLPQPRGGLLLGYAGFTRTAIRQGVATLAGLVRAELAATAPATTVPHDRGSAPRRRRLA
jgi:DNA-binding transcriptional MocR family regulator